MDRILHFDGDALELAITAVADASAGTGRHPEWIKRRLREACQFVADHDRSHPDYAAHWALAEPVLHAAAQIGGLLGGDKIH